MLTESETGQKLGIGEAAVRRLCESGQIICQEVKATGKQKSFRIPKEALRLYEKGFGVDEARAIMTQLILAGGAHNSDMQQAISETALRQRESNQLSKLKQKILAGMSLTTEEKKLLDFYHCLKDQILFTDGKMEELEKVTEDLQSRYPEMSVSEIHSLLAQVRTWMKDLGV